MSVKPSAMIVSALLGLAATVALPAGAAKPAGYLSKHEVPSSAAQLPPPPAPGSAALALDEEIARRSFALRDTPRWKQAALDAQQGFPLAAGTFSCTLGVGITQADTPHLYTLLERSMKDLGRATHSAKAMYHRQRPFLVNGQPICTPDSEKTLAAEGSYPSGHTTAGWGWALILSEVAPELTDALMVRGRTYGESRNVCNVHWHSDVVQGRNLGAGVVARLHASKAFRDDLAAARAEVEAARAKGIKPTRDCAAEAAALAVEPSLAQ